MLQVESGVRQQCCPMKTQFPIVLGAIKKKNEKKETIAKACDVFASIDPRFHDLAERSLKSKKTRLLLCRQPYNGICPCFAKPLNDLDGMFGTQAQVVQIARTHRHRLPSDGYTLWVPFLAKSQRLAAGIYFKGRDDLPSVRLQAICHHDELRLPNERNWLAIFRPDLMPAS